MHCITFCLLHLPRRPARPRRGCSSWTLTRPPPRWRRTPGRRRRRRPASGCRRRCPRRGRGGGGSCACASGSGLGRPRRGRPRCCRRRRSRPSCWRETVWESEASDLVLQVVLVTFFYLFGILVSLVHAHPPLDDHGGAGKFGELVEAGL